MKKIICFALLLSFHVVSLAQSNELHVDSVYKDGEDLSAKGADKRKYPNPDIPDDDNPAHYQSLLKIQIPLSDAKIEKENTGIVSIEYKTGEIWVWIYNGEYQPPEIKIMHENYLPLAVNLKKYGVATEGLDVYVIKVSTPSTLLEEAERLYNNIKLNDAQDAFKNILLDDDIKAADKDFAQKRIDLIPECMKINENATLFARRYIEMVRNKEASKDALIKNLENAIYWYKRLYEVSGINKARSMTNRFSEIREEISGTTVVEGTINLMQRISSGVWNKKKHGKIKNITVEITNKMLHNEVRTQIINTDKNGFFTFEIKNGYHVGLTFKCIYDGVKYQSEEIELSDDKHLNILLKSH